MHTRAKGYLLGALAAATYGLNPLFALPLYRAGMGPDSVLFFRYLFALPMLFALLRVRGGRLTVTRDEVGPLVLMGLLMGASSLTLFESYRHMQAGIASTLLFIYPVIVSGLMCLLYGELFSWLMACCMLLTLSGIGMLYKATDGATLSLDGTLLVITSAASYALYIVAINRGPLQRLPTLTTTFYVLLFGLSLFLFRVVRSGEVLLPDRWYLWGNLIALALFPTTISLVATTAAIQRIGSTPTALLGALEPVTAIVIGVVGFGERLSIRDIAGIGLILVAVTLIVSEGSAGRWVLRLRKLFPRPPKG